MKWQRLGVLFFGELTEEYTKAKAAKPITPTGPVIAVPSAALAQILKPKPTPPPEMVKPRGEEDISSMDTMVPPVTEAPIEEAERFDGKPVPAAIETVVAAGPPAPELPPVDEAPTQPVKSVKSSKKSKKKKKGR